MAIELFCEECGNELETHVLNRKVTVDLCGRCADESRDQGYEDGCDSRDDEVDSLQEQLDDLKDLVNDLKSKKS
jgi:hypothetical protein